MRRSLPFVLLACLVLGVLPGCSSIAPTEDGAIMDLDADSAIVRGSAAEARTAADGRSYQYRAVCLEASEHDGNPQVMSKWMDDPQVARELGDYHGNFKEKGHHWVIERRVRR